MSEAAYRTAKTALGTIFVLAFVGLVARFYAFSENGRYSPVPNYPFQTTDTRTGMPYKLDPQTGAHLPF